MWSSPTARETELLSRSTSCISSPRSLSCHSDGRSPKWFRPFFRAAKTRSPRIVHRVFQDLLFIRLQSDGRLRSLAVFLYMRIRFDGDVPSGPAIEVLDHANLRRFSLMVPNTDFESLLDHPAFKIDLKIGSAALAHDIERRTRIDLNGLILGRMPNLIL